MFLSANFVHVFEDGTKVRVTASAQVIITNPEVSFDCDRELDDEEQATLLEEAIEYLSANYEAGSGVH